MTDVATSEELTTAVGIPVPPFVGPEHVAPGLEERLGEPGKAPYTRGIHPLMYRSRTWTVRQLAGFGTGSDTNVRYRTLLEKGATGINGVFDYPTLRAFDSDDPLAESDVGRGGVAIDVAEDVVDLYAGIPLDRTSVSIVSSQPIASIPLFSMFLLTAEKQGVPPTALRGTSQNDFLMETCITIAPKALPPAGSFRLECDLAEYCIQHVPGWNPVSVTGYNYREAGADAVLEIALSLAHGKAVVEELVRRGADTAQAASRVSFFLNGHNDFFEEIAKFRAARRVWADVVRRDLGCSAPSAAKLRFHVQTSGMTCAAEQPLVNIARSSLQGLAAILGGAQSLHVNGYDEALSIPTEEAATIALRTQQVLLHETGVTRAADPLGGGYLVEYLTDEMEERIREQLTVIDGLGGIVAVTESGWVHRELSSRAYENMRGIADGTIPFVGVNLGRETDSTPVETFQLPEGTLERQTERLQTTRKERDASAHASAMDSLRRAVERGENAVVPTLAAVKARATLGELGALYRDVHGLWEFPI